MDTDDSGFKHFCERWLGAWTGNNPKAVADFFCEDGVYRDPSRTVGLRGRDELVSYFEILFCRNTERRFILVDCWRAEKDMIVIKWRARIPVAERLLDEVGVHLLQMKGKQIWSCEVYFDRTNWASALLSNV